MGEENLRFKREILGVAVLLLLGSLFILFPFLDAIILAVATSYFLRFGHRALNEKIQSEFLSSLIITTSIVGVVVVGLGIILANSNLIINAVTTIAFDLQQNFETLLTALDVPEQMVQEINVIDPSAVGEQIQSVLISVPSLLIDVGIYLVTAIYLYRDGGRIKSRIYEIIDNLPENEEKILRSLINSTDSIFRGVFLTQLTVALILAVITIVGFYAIAFLTSSIPFTIVWGLLIGLAALMPLFAAFMIYGPIAGYYLLFGQPVKGTLILTFGILVLNIMPEIFLRPYVGSKQMDEHPLIIFTGFIAGPLTLGIKGLILGPVMLILSKEFVLNYSELVSDAPDENRSEDTEE